MNLLRYCTVCRAQIPEDRAKKASAYCSTPCRQLARRELRAYRAEKTCRWCGRTKLKPRKPKLADACSHSDMGTAMQPVAPGATAPRQTERPEAANA